MQELIPRVQGDYEVNFIKRSRKLWSKTFGLARQIYKANTGIFHVNYALQDAYLVSKLKHLDILHIHGSDIRWTLFSHKYGWIVRSNIMKAKTVVFSTPDLLYPCESLVEYPQYLPNPVDTAKFKPSHIRRGVPCAVYFEKWYEQLPKEIPMLCRKYGVKLWVVPLGHKIPYDAMPHFLNFFDIFIDRFAIRSYSKTALEAESCGLAVIPRYTRSVEWCLERYSDIGHCRKDGLRNREYVNYYHNVDTVAEQLKKIWESNI
jgi:hypothetical protein